MAGVVGNFMNQGLNHVFGLKPIKGYIHDGYYGTEIDGIPNGYGRYYVNGQLKYEGQFRDGVFHGKGTLYTIHETTGQSRRFYKGQFYKGVFHGHGKLYDIHTGRVSYSGKFKNGKAKPKWRKLFLCCFYTKVKY